MSVEEKKEIDRLNKKLDDLRKDVSHLLFIMQSDPTTNERGLVERVRVIEVKLSELLLREEVYKAKGTVWGIIGGALITVLLWLGKFVITKVF